MINGQMRYVKLCDGVDNYAVELTAGDFTHSCV